MPPAPSRSAPSSRWVELDQWPPAARIAGRIALWISPFVLLTLLAVIVIYVRLLQAPVSLKIMAGPIERGINAELQGLTAKVDDALLRRSAAGEYEFRLVNLRLLEPDGSVVASAPIAAVSLDLSRLLLFEVLPKRVDLIEPQIAVTYSERDGLSLSFAETLLKPGAPLSPAAEHPPLVTIEAPPQSSPVAPNVLRKLDLARVIAEYSARARRREDATSTLTQVGLRNATVDVDFEGKHSRWKIAELDVDLDHERRRSVISAVTRIDSDRGPWSLSLLTEDSEKTGILKLKASIRDLVPSSLGRAFPSMALVRSLELPVAGNAEIEFRTTGEVNGAELAVEIGRGLIDFGPAMAAPMLVDAGLLNFKYDAATERLSMAPSTVRWGDSTVTLTGAVVHQTAAAAPANWAFDIHSVSGSLAAEEFKVAPVPLDAFQMSGRFTPETNRIELSNIHAKAGGGDIVLAGDVVVGDGPGAGARLDGRFGPANADVLKAVWPRMMSPRARQWFGEHVTGGRLRQGTMHFASGAYAEPGAIAGRSGVPETIAMDLTGENVSLLPLKDGPPLTAAVMVAEVRNHSLQITTPEAVLVSGDGQGITLKQGQFTVADVDAPIAHAEMAFKAQSALAPAVSVMQHMKLLDTSKFAVPTDKVLGKLDGDFKIRLPLLPEMEPDTVVITGKAKITDVKAKEKIGIINLQSGAVDVLLSERESTARGELILNGVVAKLDWRRQIPIDGSPSVTSPLTITANLDNSDRRQLGVDVAEYVDGDVPVSVAFGNSDPNAAQVRVAADLSQADFSISPLAFKKPRGRPARLEFDVVSGTTSKTELRNFKITGDDIAAEGWIGISADQKVQEFDFPALSINTVSQIQISGKRNARDVLDVKATGKTFDGRDFFRSLFTFGSGHPSQANLKKSGIDLTATIDNVLGHSETNLRNVSMRLSKRGNELTALDARGSLPGGKALIAILQAETNGERRVIADTTDAGQTLRLVGFYPNMQGGRGRIDIFLDGKDPAQRAGVLIIEDFKVLGDPIVSEVVSSASGEGPAIGASTYGGQKVVREVFEFDRMRLPFNVGYGQFAIEDSYLRGPLLGATVRGKVDFGAQKVNLGGTYVPLQGLNNALGGIPLLGQILSGPRGEGIFGITFAVQGAMSNPQVIVNPLSLVAPGIFREMFQMTNPNTDLKPRAPSPAEVPANKRVRASSSGGTYQAPEGVDGWSSDTVVPSKKN